MREHLTGGDTLSTAEAGLERITASDRLCQLIVGLLCDIQVISDTASDRAELHAQVENQQGSACDTGQPAGVDLVLSRGSGVVQ